MKRPAAPRIVEAILWGLLFGALLAAAGLDVVPVIFG